MFITKNQPNNPKKGQQSAGVKRPYSGTAGRVENCQVGVFLAYATADGAAFLDRRLYLPKEGVADSERCQRAGIPQATSLATKLELAQQMLGEAIEAKVPFSGVTGESIYGGDRHLRRWLEEQQVPFLFAPR
ncbi:MAG: transposase [Ferruginibacter sp.]|nr:transposase [Cytophagales bacterium]